MKNIRKITAVLLTSTLVLSAGACGKTNGAEASGSEESIANPIIETTESKLAEETGIGLAAPDGAENVSYSYIEATDDAGETSQVDFTLDGISYCYRAQSSSLTSLFGEESADTLPDMDSVLETGQALSGIYDEFKSAATATVSYCDAFCSWSEGKSGFVVWLDPVPGILYSLSTSDGASEDALLNTANQVFVPAQGDSDGDASIVESSADASDASEAEGDISADISSFAGTYTRQEDSSTLTINEDGSVEVSIERLTTMEGSVTGVEKEIAAITTEDASGGDMGLEFNIETHELIVTDSTWDLLENGTSFQFERR